MQKLEKTIGYKFNDEELLRTALTHSSYANENKKGMRFNERLEFLGDAVLQLITSEKLYTEHPDMPEGNMSKQRAALVCEEALSEYARSISLGEYLYVGKGEEVTGGRNRNSVLSDAFEALTGAIYLDGGFENAKTFVRKFIDEAHLALQDFKTQLQEIIQQNPGERISYVLVGEEGPDHDKTFTIEVRLNSNPIGTGKGKNKKAAEQAAAKEALELMGYKFSEKA